MIVRRHIAAAVCLIHFAETLKAAHQRHRIKMFADEAKIDRDLRPEKLGEVVGYKLIVAVVFDYRVFKLGFHRENGNIVLKGFDPDIAEP